MTDAVERTPSGRLANAWLGCAPWVFVREMLSQPAAVGAIWPSSCRLAGSLASRVPLHGNGLVVELGGGTGAVTRALLQRGIAAERLVVIERSPAFVRHLRARFPGTIVVQGDAAELAELLPAGGRIGAIVSSLPLRSLPSTKAAAVVAQWGALMADGGIVVQFTYDLSRSEYQPPQGFFQRSSHIVWVNLPPARVRVMEYRRADRNPEISSNPP